MSASERGRTMRFRLSMNSSMALALFTILSSALYAAQLGNPRSLAYSARSASIFSRTALLAG